MHWRGSTFCLLLVVWISCCYSWQVQYPKSVVNGGRLSMKMNDISTATFTSQLNEFKKSDKAKYTFSSTLKAPQRAVLHKLCLKMGLKSKSSSTGGKRILTVTKAFAAPTDEAISPIMWTPQEETMRYLSKLSQLGIGELGGLTDRISKYMGSNRFVKMVPQSHGGLAKAYLKAQEIRKAHKEYNSTTKKRKALPASNYESIVCNMLKANQIILITGDTGE